MKKIPFSEFTNVHQTATITAGSSGTVFTFNIPESLVAFIEKLANNWFASTYLTWSIDGQVIEPRIERTIGFTDNPQIYKPPFVAYRQIKFEATNNDTLDNLFEVYCDGYLVQKRRS